MKKRFYKQSGGASLLVTVVLAVLLLGVVGGLTTLSVRELRQASNTEQSNRALAAAESFVEKQANKIATADDPSTLYSDTCRNETIGSGSDNITITCYTVTAGKGDVAEKSLARDRSFKLELVNMSTPISSMTIDWENEGRKNVAPYANPGWPSGIDGSLEGSPAAIETSFVWWSGSNISPLNDQNGNFGLPLKKYLTKPGATSDKISTECSTDKPFEGGYYCRTSQKITLKSITGLDSVNNLVFKITPRYSPANVRIKFFDSTGKQLEVPLPYAKIDVTARANNLYRRVVATKDLDPSTSFSFLDGNVLFSGDNICKSLIVGANNAPVNGGDGKNSSNCEQ